MSTETRKPIYAYVEGILGRKITVTEHEELKKLILTHDGVLTEENRRLNASMQRRGQQAKKMGQIIYKKAWEAEILEKDIKFLKELFEEK